MTTKRKKLLTPAISESPAFSLRDDGESNWNPHAAGHRALDSYRILMSGTRIGVSQAADIANCSVAYIHAELRRGTNFGAERVGPYFTLDRELVEQWNANRKPRPKAKKSPLRKPPRKRESPRGKSRSGASKGS